MVEWIKYWLKLLLHNIFIFLLHFFVLFRICLFFFFFFLCVPSLYPIFHYLSIYLSICLNPNNKISCLNSFSFCIFFFIFQKIYSSFYHCQHYHHRQKWYMGMPTKTQFVGDIVFVDVQIHRFLLRFCVLLTALIELKSTERHLSLISTNVLDVIFATASFVIDNQHILRMLFFFFFLNKQKQQNCQHFYFFLNISLWVNSWEQLNDWIS